MLERLKHAQIAHDRRDQGVVGEHATLAHGHRQYRHDLVTIDVRTLCVHGKTTVSVAIQGDATVRSSLDHSFLELLQVCGAVAFVDVQTVGLAADDRDLGTSLAEGFRGNHAGSAVSGIQHHVPVSYTHLRAHETDSY